MTIDNLCNFYDKFIEVTDFENNDKKVNNLENQNSLKAENNYNTCFLCKSKNIITDSNLGMMVCDNCGQVSESNMIDYAPEWKQYEDDSKDDARCGIPINMLLPISSLGSSIGGKWSILKKLHNQDRMPYKERSRYKEFKKISDACKKGNLLKCIEDDAKILLKLVTEVKHTKGRNIGKQVITRGINRTSINAACLFLACVRKGIARTAKEIVKLYDNLSVIDLNRGCKQLRELLLLKGINIQITSVKPEFFIIEHCDNLSLKVKYKEQAYKIAKNINKLNLTTEHTPYSIASASILLVVIMNKLDITQKDIVNEFNISELTMIRTYYEIEQYADILNDDDKTNDLVNKMNCNKNVILTHEIQKLMNCYNIKPEHFGMKYKDFIEQQ